MPLNGLSPAEGQCFVARYVNMLLFPMILHDSYRIQGWFFSVKLVCSSTDVQNQCFYQGFSRFCRIYAFSGVVFSVKRFLLHFTTFLQGFRGGGFFCQVCCTSPFQPQHKACYMKDFFYHMVKKRISVKKPALIIDVLLYYNTILYRIGNLGSVSSSPPGSVLIPHWESGCNFLPYGKKDRLRKKDWT